MKRSEINAYLREADQFIRERGFYLPPFAHWTPQEWTTRGEEVREIAENRLGWDITDFDRGDFQRSGLLLFTIRNGQPSNWQTRQGKLYAEKILIVGVDQVAPLHFHWQKTEDIINRGGGDLLLQLYHATADEQLDETSPVSVSIDGMRRTFQPGETVVLTPGESITLPTRCYHKFWGAKGRVLAGEVSSVNDDDIDNRFLEPMPRFSQVEEDEPPLYLLCTDYQKYYRPAR